MKLKATRNFYDRLTSEYREKGDKFEADADRANELIEKGFAKLIPEKEKEK